ncbi:MAG: antirestriction protein ArdA [Sulfurimonas sp.]|nr:antirestriction protein ArdA [Sulfurimonas sp.]MBU3939599.1 antirestriction protein ArdA [bacterium]MBU4003004.1 antirestriction protein ArdA [Pseudomonadota bacterium]
MRVYITDLEAYNNGYLVGRWVDLPMNDDLLAECVENILQEGRDTCNHQHFHEEYFITDFECEYMTIEEYSPLGKYNHIAEDMEGIDEDGVKAIKFLMENNLVKDIFEAMKTYEDSVRIYENQSMEDIAYDYIQECYSFENIPDIIANNIDYEKIGRDLEIEGSYYKIDNDIYEYIG